MTSNVQSVDSSMSSPVSVQELSSALSDIESTASLGDNKRHLRDDLAAAALKTKPVHREFTFADGNVEVQTADQLFWVHEYHLNKFSVMTSLIQEARSSGTSASDRRIKIVCDGSSVDFCNTFQILYASVVPGVPTFDSATLISALRVASAYNYPELRNFAISGLEKMSLPAIKRVELSDEFSLPEWEPAAFSELCHRAEAISPSEAQILGIERFAQVARIREAGQRHKLIQVFDKLVEPHSLLGPEGKVNLDALKRDADYSSSNKSLPTCDCRVQLLGKTNVVTHCQIHTVAPLVLKEGHTLFTQRNDLLKQLGNVKQAIFSQQKATSENTNSTSIEEELSQAPWIRRASKNWE